MLTTPYQELCHLLYEYKKADDAMDDEEVYTVAFSIYDAAARMLADATKRWQPETPRQLLLPIEADED